MSDPLPHGGSYFDDLRADDQRTAESKRKKRAVVGVDDDMVPFFTNIRNRPHSIVFVKNETVAKGIHQLMLKWHIDGTLRSINDIVLDPNMRITDIRVSQ